LQCGEEEGEGTWSYCLKTKITVREGWLTNVPLCFCLFFFISVFLSVCVLVPLVFFCSFVCSLLHLSLSLSLSLSFSGFRSSFSLCSFGLPLHSLRLFLFSLRFLSVSSCSLSSVPFFSLSVLPSFHGLLWLFLKPEIGFSSCVRVHFCFFEKKQRSNSRAINLVAPRNGNVGIVGWRRGPKQFWSISC
jgi:hypothetical protein